MVKSFFKLEEVNPDIHKSINEMANKVRDIAEKIKNRQKFLDVRRTSDLENYLEGKTVSKKRAREGVLEFNAIKDEVGKLKEKESGILARISELVNFYANFADVNSDMCAHADAQSAETESRARVDACFAALGFADTIIDRAKELREKLDDKMIEFKDEEFKLNAMKEGDYSEEEIVEQEKVMNNVYKGIMRLIQKRKDISEEDRKALENFNPKIEQ